MRASKMIAPTLREVPAEAEVISHILLLRAGFIRKLAAGVYVTLPLGQRVIRKISDIVRSEMDRVGGQEVTLPIMQPAELWLESGRWHVYGDELFRLKDRHGRDFALSPTAEEVITDLIRGEIRSYKQLPVYPYQIGNKYRDERRPRFGLMRGREFIMKDMYSFDRDEAGLEESYWQLYHAYENIFNRCGVEFRPVEADSGAIGGSDTHEFMVIADSGEAAIVYCDQCDYSANIERAETKIKIADNNEAVAEIKEVHTPNQRTINEVAEFLQVGAEKLIKTLIYKAIYQDHEELVVALIRGDREINEIKLLNKLDCLAVEMAPEEDVHNLTGAGVGFAGPIGLPKVRMLADLEVPQIVNAITGANKTDYHLLNVNIERDFQVELVTDLRLVGAGEPCPKCNGTLKAARGIEVGQVFKLGTKYSKALNAKYLDENGKEQYMVMGCYGVGVGRTMAASIEQNNDQDGIIWPVSIAPYHAVIIPINYKDEAQRLVADKIYQELWQHQIEVVLDDRNERTGVKFKDADLIGYPCRITIGPKTMQEGQVEIRFRKSGEVILKAYDQVTEFLKGYIADQSYKTFEE